MGYTHYWDVSANITDEAWEKFCNFVKAAIKVTKHEGTPIVGWDSEHGTPPEVSDERVAFNGLVESGHETFCVDREGDEGFGFCKTARKPYDALVVACCVAGVEVGIFDDWSSDGDNEEGVHTPGYELYNDVLDDLGKDLL